MPRCLCLGQSIGVDPVWHLHQAGLAMTKVSGGGNIKHGIVLCPR